MKKLFTLLAVVATLFCGNTAKAQQTPESGKSYYLYNVESGMLLTRGNSWGTRAIVNDYGQPWVVTVTEGKYKLQMLDIVSSGSDTGLGDNSFTDNGTPIEFTPSGDANGYTLNYDAGWLDVTGNLANVAGTSSNKTWQFLNVDEYKAVLVQKNTVQNQALIDASLIDATPATLATVLTSATITDKTEDAGLSGVPTKETWTESHNSGRGGNYNAGDYGLEFYQGGDVNFTKTISGLAKGIYKVKVKAMFRSVNNTTCYTIGEDGYVNSSAYFSANGYTAQVKDWYSSCRDNGTPNSTGVASEIMSEGGYTSEVYTYVGDAGQLNLKLAQESYWGACWLIFGGVELTYYSDYATQELKEGSDLTGWLLNPSFEDDFSGWTQSGSLTAAIQTNGEDVKVGSKYAEYWQPNGTVDLSQTLKDMPTGTYLLTAHVRTRGTQEVYLYANDSKQNVEIDNTTKDVTLEFPLDNGTAKCGIYAKGTGAGGSWIAVDNFRLTYKSKDIIFSELPAVVEGKMNTEVAAAQANAVAAFTAENTVANYNAAINAINAALASKTAYESINKDLTTANEILNSTNVYTATAYKAYKTAINDWQKKYDEGTLTNDESNDAHVQLVGPANYNKPANVMTAYISSAWSATNDVNVYTNDWSWEGGQEGNSGLTTPFIENWVANANKLADAEVSATMSELPNGLYKVTALVRLTNSKEGDDAGFDGVTFFANDVTSALTEGATYPDGVLHNVEVEALVKDGNLKMGYTVASTNVSWIAMKNVNYTFVRELTEEEKMVYATAEEIAALNAAIAAAEGNAVGFQKGQYSPYTNKEAIEALASAKAIDTTVPVSQESVLAATNALTSATWTVNTEEVNAIFNGDFEASYTEKSGTGVSSDRAIYTPEGWTVDYKGDKNDMTVLNSNDKASNNFTGITALTDGGNNTYLYRGKWGSTTNISVYQNITLPAGTYDLTCDAWKSGLGGNATIFVDSETATLTANATEWKNLSLRFTLEEEKTIKVGFNIVHNSDGSEKFIGFDNFVLKSTPMTEVTASVGTAKYGTFCAPFDVEITAEAVTVYTVDGQEGNVLILNEVTDKKIAAHTPVILNSDVTYTNAFTGIATEGTPKAGLLVGTYNDITAPAGSYVLQNHSGVVGFYQVGETKPTVKAFRAYLQTESEVKGFYFNQTDAINAIEALTNGAKIYDINGRELNKLQKGINIVNGCKILVK